MSNSQINIVVVHGNDQVVIPVNPKSISEIKKINVGMSFGIREGQEKKNSSKNETGNNHEKSKTSNKNHKQKKDFMLCFGKRTDCFKRVVKNQKKRFFGHENHRNRSSKSNSRNLSMIESCAPTWYCVIFIIKLKFAWASSKAIKLFEEWKYD